MASVDTTIALTLATDTSSKTAWEFLHMGYANKIHTRTFSLHDQLQNIKKASKSVTEYLQEV